MVDHRRQVQNNRSHTPRQSARSSPKPPDRVHLLRHLQGQAGNRAVTQLTRAFTIQPKLTVTPAGDIYEQEADHVANQVLQQIRSGAGGNEVQRQEEEEMQMNWEAAIQRQEIPEEEEALQMQPDGTVSTSGTLTTAIQDSRGKGRPLPDGTRKPFEQALDSNFENVHVHEDAEADRMSRSMRARAFTVGSDIYFRQNAYVPESTSGQRLLAHELTHVIQQGFAPTQSDVEEKSETDQN